MGLTSRVHFFNAFINVVGHCQSYLFIILNPLCQLLFYSTHLVLHKALCLYGFESQ